MPERGKSRFATVSSTYIRRRGEDGKRRERRGGKPSVHQELGRQGALSPPMCQFISESDIAREADGPIGLGVARMAGHDRAVGEVLRARPARAPLSHLNAGLTT